MQHKARYEDTGLCCFVQVRLFSYSFDENGGLFQIPVTQSMKVKHRCGS
ncbi:hypothetical protein ACFFGT_06155 [Mucilaginibacter angelicae]|uniref:Uncharacterized protein n=1 Tax=Mucilaginibacter angelicae TaxID=869718 RepID=A0ABV6L292_9SPHI